MMQSEIVKVSIARPFAEVYEFLSEPMNFVRWAANPGSTMVPLDGGDWLVELAPGKRVIRFAPRNTFGVLDYQTFAEGENGGPVTPVRLVPNEGGCELILLWFRRPGADDARLASDIEWVRSDLERVKALIEVR